MGAPLLDSRIDALYGLSLADFIAGRKALMDQLRRAGDRAGAGAVKSLVKPSLSAWITNQTVRRAPALVQQLLAATQELGAAQRAAARTGDTQQRFQDARAEQRRLIERLMDVARAVVAPDGGAAPGDANPHLEKVERNLTWGPLSQDDVMAFQRGRLLADVPPPGFAALAGGEDVAPEASSPVARTAPLRLVPAQPPTAQDRARNDAAELRQAEEARAAQKRLQEQRAAETRAALLRAQADTARARQVLERTARVRDQEQQNVDKATRALDSARVALDTAEAAHESARAAMEACEAAEASARQPSS